MFALLDKVQSDEEEDIEELMNDSDTEFLANDEDIENVVPNSDNADISTPEASIHIVIDNEKEQGKKFEDVQFQWRHNIAPNIREECNLVGDVSHQLKWSASSLEAYEFYFYLGKKQNVEINLGEDVVMQLSEKLKGIFCTLFFDKFFNSPLLINKLFGESIYVIGTVRSNRKHMPKLKDDKKMARGDSDFQFSKNVICCKWFDNKLVLLLATNIEGMDGTSNVMRRSKGSATKTPVLCPNIIKMYNSSMSGVDVIGQKTAAYQLDRKSKFTFYLRMFFDLIDIAIVNSHIVYTKLGNSISLLDFKIVVAKSLIGRYSNRQRSFPLSRTSK